MGKLSHRAALVVSILSWFMILSVLLEVLERAGIPIEVDAPTTKMEFDRDSQKFVEYVVSGHSNNTGATNFCIVFSLVLSFVVYRLIDRRTPISMREKRWLVYIVVGYAVWTFSGEWLRTPIDMDDMFVWMQIGEWIFTPLDASIKTHMMYKLLHLAIGAGIVGLFRWDYMRTFARIDPLLSAG